VSNAHGHFPQQVDYVEYMDKIASMIGCRPCPLRTLLWDTDWPLFRALIFGANAPYVYRLKGPKQWLGARKALLNLKRRVNSGMSGKILETKCRRCGMAIDDSRHEERGRIAESKDDFCQENHKLCEQCLLRKDARVCCPPKLYLTGSGILAFVLFAAGFIYYWTIFLNL